MKRSELPLEKHPFFVLLSELTVAFIRDVAEEPTPDDPYGYRQKRPSLPSEEYSHAVFLAMAEVAQLLQQMTYTPAMLGSWRSTPNFKKTGVTRFEYLIYQLENWFLRSTALLDRSLILTNEVCRLGLRPRGCKFHVVTTNLHVSKSPIDVAIRALDKHLRSHRAIRNRIAHEKRLQPSGWTELEGISILAHSSPDLVPKRDLKRRIDEAVASQQKIKEDELAVSVKLTEDILSALLPRFEENHARAV